MQALPAAERKALRENIKNMSPEERREFMQKEYK
jgi:DNA-directed RNA polymerase specialized sigma24 family protein